MKRQHVWVTCPMCDPEISGGQPLHEETCPIKRAWILRVVKDQGLVFYPDVPELEATVVIQTGIPDPFVNGIPTTTAVLPDNAA